MSDLLKGNYALKLKEPSSTELREKPSLEALFESSAMEKLGGSMAFVKKSASFVWKGDATK